MGAFVWVLENVLVLGAHKPILQIITYREWDSGITLDKNKKREKKGKEEELREGGMEGGRRRIGCWGELRDEV